MTVTFRGEPHESAHDALTELNFSGDHVISVGGTYYTVTDAEYAKLQAAGVQPTTWHDLHGQIISVPGNLN